MFTLKQIFIYKCFHALLRDYDMSPDNIRSSKDIKLTKHQTFQYMNSDDISLDLTMGQFDKIDIAKIRNAAYVYIDELMGRYIQMRKENYDFNNIQLPRRYHIKQMLKSGMSNKEICDVFNISKQHVNQLRNAFERYYYDDIMKAIRRGVANDVIALEFDVRLSFVEKCRESDKIRGMYAQGMSADDISLLYTGYSINFIKTIIDSRF